jgi:carbamoyltransferase
MNGAHFALGVNISHDRSAVLTRDGQVLFGIAEERLDRNKHSIVEATDGSFLNTIPRRAIEYCLMAAGVSWDELDDVVVVGSVIYHPNRQLRNPTIEEVAGQLPEVPTERITLLNHHLAHAAAAYFASPFDSAAILVADGAGNIAHQRRKRLFSLPDVEHTTIYSAAETKVVERAKICAEAKAMNSLGALYHLVTLHAGFGQFEEGKTMGLAASGNDSLLPLFRQAVHIDGLGYSISPEFQPFDLKGRLFHRAFAAHFGPPRQKDEPIRDQDREMAYAVQAVLEERMIELGRTIRETTGQTRLCYSGGVALNAVVNGRLSREAGFDDLFIVPCSGDDGTALGAALWAWRVKRGGEKTWSMNHPFLGRTYSDREIERALSGFEGMVQARRVSDPAFEAARMIADGAALGWFQGGSEIGPRALGHRSILADPRRADMKDRINEKIKRRESFRPFAPSVLEGRAVEYFDVQRPAPFMLETARVTRPEAIPAVTHDDQMARLQTVNDGPENRLFYDLIRAFDSLTGVPVVLNTSFNQAGEPIVESPEDAVSCLTTSRLDALVIGDYLVTKTHPEMCDRIADLTCAVEDQQRRIQTYETEMESIRGSRGWKLLAWFNRIFRPWKKHRRPDIL